MRMLIVAALAALAVLQQPAPASAQGYTPPDVSAQRAAMARLEPMIGHWAGLAQVYSPSAMDVHQTELVEADLDGALLIVRGVGYDNPAHAGAPVWRALAVMSYDDQRRLYEFRTYARGHASTATGQFLENGAFRWSLAPGGPVRVRYTIRIDGDSWGEIGEMSYDNGQTWTRTIEMNLTRTR